MNNKYVKMLGVGLLVVGLVAWRQSIITMEPEESKDWNWKEVQKGRSKEYSELLQDAVKNAEAEAEKDKATEKLVRGFLPPDMQKEIFKNKPAHPFLLRYLISKLCPMPKRILIYEGNVLSVAFSPDSKFILAGSNNTTAKLWSIETGKEMHTFKSDGLVYSVAFRPDGNYVLIGSTDKTAKLWDANTGNLIRTFDNNDKTISVAFSPDGKFILTGSGDGAAKLWSVETGKEIRTFNHNQVVDSVAFSPDGNYVLTGSWDKTAKLWDANTGNLIRIFNQNDMVYGIAFSPDGNYVLTGSRGNTAQLWSVETGDLMHTLHHNHSVKSVAFSPDGKYVLTGSWDKTAKLWDANTGGLIHTFNDDNSVFSVAFSPDGKYVLIGAYNDMIKLYDISCITKLVKDMTFVTVDQYNLLQACGDILEKFLVKKEKLGRINLNENQVEVFDALPQDIKKELEFIVKRPELKEQEKEKVLTDEEKREIAREANLKKFDKSNK